MIVIDCINFPFKYHCKDSVRERSQAIQRMALGLRELAHRLDVAIVIVNGLLKQRESSILVPSLGDTWGMFIDYRIRLDCRKASLVRSNIDPKGSATSVEYIILVSNIALESILLEQRS